MVNMIFAMLGETLLLCAICVLFWLLKTKTNLSSLGIWWWRLIYIITFLGYAIFATHCGFSYNGAVINTRDLAPLALGLMFDPLSGLIVGVLAGIERFAVGTWAGIGQFTAIACCVSTCIAGIIPVFLNKPLKRSGVFAPLWTLLIGAAMEAIHMCLILLINIAALETAYSVVSAIAAPMIVYTAIGLALSFFLVAFFEGRYQKRKERTKNES